MCDPGKDESLAPVCQVCGEALDGRRHAVSCSRCHTPHHRDCWAFAGGCSTFACGSAHALPGVASGLAAGHAPGRELRIDHQGAGTVDERPVRLPTVARPRTFVPPTAAAALDPDWRYTRLDVDLPLEKWLQWGALAVLAFSVVGVPPAPRGPNWVAYALLWPVALSLMVVRLGVDCTYLLDGVSRRILYARSVFGRTETWSVCRFDQVARVGIVSENHSDENRTRWYYAVVMELPHGVRVQVSFDTEDYQAACGLARALATRLGATLVTSKPMTPGMNADCSFPELAPSAGHSFLPKGLGRLGVFSLALFAVTVLLNLGLVLLLVR